MLSLRGACSLLHTGPATPSLQRLQPLSQVRFRLFRVRSPLLAESRLFSLPQGTEMFQFPWLPPHTYAFSVRYWPITTSGFPHSDIHASTLAYSSTWHFGVRPVLRRLLAPRHPPCALPTFTCLRPSIRFGLLRRLRALVTHVPYSTLVSSRVQLLAFLASQIPHAHSYPLCSCRFDFFIGVVIQFPRYIPALD